MLQQISIVYKDIISMGNQQPKKVGRANKNQIQMACLKARIHLELMRDRRSQQIIKGEKQLVAKLNAKSRNRTEEGLIMERVVNGLKYSQAVNQLISYAASLKSQSTFLAENIGNQEKLQPWLTPVYTLIYAADQLGLSSLNEYKSVMKALNDPLQAQKYINPEIKQLLSPTPSPYQVNIYVLEMCQRNNIQLQQINAAGHKFARDPHPPQSQQDKSFADIEKQLAEQFQKQLGGKNMGNNKNNNGFGNNQGGNNQGGFGGGFNGGFHQDNYFNGGFGGQGGQGGQGGFYNPNSNHGGYYDNSQPTNKYDSNPYKGASSLNHGPTYFTPSQIKPKNSTEDRPKQFPSYDNLNLEESRKTVNPIYPSVNPNAYKGEAYSPMSPHDSIGNNEANQSTNSKVKGSPNDEAGKSPTISQIMRDFDLK